MFHVTVTMFFSHNDNINATSPDDMFWDVPPQVATSLGGTKRSFDKAFSGSKYVPNFFLPKGPNVQYNIGTFCGLMI
jgi:hypothetical protein